MRLTWPKLALKQKSGAKTGKTKKEYSFLNHFDKNKRSSFRTNLVSFGSSCRLIESTRIELIPILFPTKMSVNGLSPIITTSLFANLYLSIYCFMKSGFGFFAVT